MEEGVGNTGGAKETGDKRVNKDIIIGMSQHCQQKQRLCVCVCVFMLFDMYTRCSSVEMCV